MFFLTRILTMDANVLKHIDILTEIFENPMSWSKEVVVAVGFSSQRAFDQPHRPLATLSLYPVPVFQVALVMHDRTMVPFRVCAL